MAPSDPHNPTTVLLISCYELGHQPLGIVVPGGVLERAGIPVAYNDIAVEKLDEESVATACLVGISVPMHTALRLGVRVAERVRELNPKAHICFYGLYAELNAEYLRGRGADSCLGAEPEADLLDLARRVAGLHVGTGDARSNTDLTPVRTGLRSASHYVKLDDGEGMREVGYVASTRGCKHICRHCPLTPVYRGRFRAMPVEPVLKDIESLVEQGATHITFADPDFLNGPGQARRVGAGVRERFPGVTFDYTAKVEHLAQHRALVEELQELGNLFVVTALESFNDEVLRHLHKGHTSAMALEVIDHFRGIGLTLRPTLVPFTPWETMESLVALFERVAREGIVNSIDPVQYSIRLLVPPGSALLELPAMTPHLDALDAANFTHTWRHPDARMDRLQRELAGMAERATATKERPTETFHAMWRAACEAAGLGAPGGDQVPAPPERARPPRLTEAWFC